LPPNLLDVVFDMGKVKKSIYRQPVTAEGLKKIEKGQLEWFDVEMFSNLNTGVMEQYLEEKNRRDGFKVEGFDWKKVGIGILVGMAFAIITEYVGLKVGLAMSGAWYVVYLVGLSLKWKPQVMNVAVGASNATSYVSTGFIFTFPALFLLWKSDEYLGEGGVPLIQMSKTDVFQFMILALTATIIAGILGMLYFIIFRRIWLVDDPLPTPGFEAPVKLLEISNSMAGGAVDQARKSIRTVIMWGGFSAVLVFFRDMPLGASRESALHKMFAGTNLYEAGDLVVPYNSSISNYTILGFGLIPIQFGVGWFMKFKTALLVSLGTLLTWFVIVPMAAGIDVPVFNAVLGEYMTVSTEAAYQSYLSGHHQPTAMIAYAKVARFIAVGAILGGGITALIKMAPVFKDAIADATKSGGSEGAWIEGKGWYEWPASHIKIMIVVAVISIFVIFVGVGGFPLGASLVFVIILAMTTFALGAIAVKVMGETGTEPVSGTSFIVLVFLMGVFSLMSSLTVSEMLVLTIIGTTVFAGAISLSGDVVMNFKAGLYCGNRPYHIMKAGLTGIIPGAIFSVIGAYIFGMLLAEGKMNLLAPQARSFATFMSAIVGGDPTVYQMLALGAVIGVFVELISGMGTAFGLGMYFPLSLSFPMLAGGAARDYWEKYRLEPRAKSEKWDERRRTMALIQSYMMATGLIVGEAIMGTVVAIVLVMQG